MSTVRSILHSIPRFTLSLQSAPASIDAIIDAPIDYAISLGIIGAWCLLFLLLYTVVDISIATCGRCCCNRTPIWIKHRYLVSVVVSVAAIVLLLSAIMPNYETSDNVDSLLDSFHQIIATKDALGTRATTIVNLAQQQSSIAAFVAGELNITDIQELEDILVDIQTQTDGLLALSSNSTNEINDVFDYVNEYDDLRRNVITLALATNAVFIVLLILVYRFKAVCFLPQIMQIVTWLFLFIVWVTTIAQLLVVVVLSDVCEQNPTEFFNQYINEHMTDGETKSMALYYLNCNDVDVAASNPLNVYISQAQVAVNSSIDIVDPLFQLVTFLNRTELFDQFTMFSNNNDEIQLELESVKQQVVCTGVNTIYNNIVNTVCDDIVTDWFALVALCMSACVVVACARWLFVDRKEIDDNDKKKKKQTEDEERSFLLSTFKTSVATTK